MRVFTGFCAFIAMFSVGALYGAMRNGALEVGGDSLVETACMISVTAFVVALVKDTAEYLRSR